MIPYFSFDKIIFGPITVQVWGLMASFGFLLAIYFSLREAKKKNIDENHIWTLFPILLVAMIVGAKLFYLIGHLNSLARGENIIFSGSGFSLMGGIVFSVVVFYYYAKSKKIDIYKLADIFIPGTILAIIAIRMGCFLIYDHVGRITSLPWGRLYIDGTLRHPIALYHIGSGLVIFLLICYLKERDTKKGILTLAFVFSYIISRILLDFTRCLDLSVCDSRYFGLTYTQLLLLIILPFIFFITKKYFK